MTNIDLCFTPATKLAAMIRRGAVSPVEMVQAVLARLERVNPRLNAYCTVAAEQALEAARKATAVARRRSARLGPLHGVPVSIKDLTPTKGIRTTWGSKIYEHHVPDEDALVVTRLKAAGAIVLGKTNTPEFGAGANTFNAVFGVTRNPWNPTLTPGGSTGGGAVALATGLGPLAQGTVPPVVEREEGLRRLDRKRGVPRSPATDRSGVVEGRVVVLENHSPAELLLMPGDIPREPRAHFSMPSAGRACAACAWRGAATSASPPSTTRCARSRAPPPTRSAGWAPAWRRRIPISAACATSSSPAAAPRWWRATKTAWRSGATRCRRTSSRTSSTAWH